MSFPPPVFTPGSLEASRAPIVAQFGSGVEGGFTLVSSSSGRRWHMIKADRDCQFGRIFLAVEVVYFPSSESWQFQGRGSFAIKVSDLPQKHFSRGCYTAVITGTHLLEFWQRTPTEHSYEARFFVFRNDTRKNKQTSIQHGISVLADATSSRHKKSKQLLEEYVESI